jgi:hypothetical protein
MGGTCSMHEGDLRNVHNTVVTKPQGKIRLDKHRRKILKWVLNN